MRSPPVEATTRTNGASGSTGLSDGVFACGARTADQLLAQFTTTYTYEFNDENAPPPQSDIPGLTFPLGAYHGSEIQYLFDSDYYYLLNASQQQLAAAMVSYWTTFAATGNPNSSSNPTWSPAFSSRSPGSCQGSTEEQ